MDNLLLLAILVILEAVLSADNAIALASISQSLENKKLQRKALNIGLLVAFALRMGMIIAATFVIDFWQFEVVGAVYLLWLVFQFFTSEEDDRGEHRGPKYTSLWQVIPLIAMTDLAFSLDSVTTAIAISEETWLILTGAALGIIALRFLAGLFISWLEEFRYLETAGYITVGLVGIRLLVRVINPAIVPPEWLMISVIAMIFMWGFSQRNTRQSETESYN
ncbi:MAG: hypothetical protein WBA93_14460 [Microcoleaceae cyanobacterium]